MKLLIHGYFGAGNAGDDALLHSMIDQIVDSRPNCQIVVTVRSKRIAAYQGSASIRTISGADIATVYREISTCDAVVVGGGGLFQDYLGYNPTDLFNGGRGSINYYVVPLILARIVGKPIMLYAVGVGPFQSEEARRAVGWFANAATTVTVRDRASADHLTRLGVTGAIQTADPALNLIPAVPPSKVIRALPSAGRGPIVGVNLRTWVFGEAGTMAYQAVTQVCRHLLQQHQATILICPFNRSERELDLANKLALNIGRARVQVMPYKEDPASLKWLCGRLDLVIGMRLHAAILALSAGTPAIGLAYDPKVTQLFEDAGLSQLCLPADRIDTAQLIRLADNLLDRNSHWRTLVRTHMAPLQQRERLNLQHLLKTLERTGKSPGSTK